MNREMSDWPIHAWRYFHPISLCHPPKLRHASALHRPASHRDRPRPRQMKSREECMALSRRSWSIRAMLIQSEIMQFQYVLIHVNVRCSLGYKLE